MNSCEWSPRTSAALPLLVLSGHRARRSRDLFRNLTWGTTLASLKHLSTTLGYDDRLMCIKRHF